MDAIKRKEIVERALADLLEAVVAGKQALDGAKPVDLADEGLVLFLTAIEARCSRGARSAAKACELPGDLYFSTLLVVTEDLLARERAERNK